MQTEKRWKSVQANMDFIRRKPIQTALLEWCCLYGRTQPTEAYKSSSWRHQDSSVLGWLTAVKQQSNRGGWVRAQQIKELAIRPSNLSSIPGTHKVEGETQFLHVVLCPPHLCSGTRIHQTNKCSPHLGVSKATGLTGLLKKCTNTTAYYDWHLWVRPAP